MLCIFPNILGKAFGFSVRLPWHLHKFLLFFTPSTKVSRYKLSEEFICGERVKKSVGITVIFAEFLPFFTLSNVSQFEKSYWLTIVCLWGESKKSQVCQRKMRCLWVASICSLLSTIYNIVSSSIYSLCIMLIYYVLFSTSNE